MVHEMLLFVMPVVVFAFIFVFCLSDFNDDYQ